MSPILENILTDFEGKVEGYKLYNYLKKSASADFYNQQFKQENNSIPNETPDLSDVPKEMAEIIAFLKKNVNKDAVLIELGGSRHQQRSGYPNYHFNNYIPLDISYSSIKAYVDSYDRFGIVADACTLPFKDQSVDVIFTHTFLEHPLKPQEVVSEICRVIKPGGFVIHSDAWNCRWWQRYGIIGVKKLSSLSLKEKVVYVAAKITEIKLLRYSVITFKRGLSLLFRKKYNSPLKYNKLTPNYNLHLYKDEDAASSIDPVNIILYYESRGFATLPQLSFLSKVFFKHPTVFLQKKI